MNTEEIQELENLVATYIDPTRYHLGSKHRKAMKYDKRPQMYGGEGVVYLLHMFNEEELVHNRFAAYMVLPTKADSCGFHTHGTRH